MIEPPDHMCERYWKAPAAAALRPRPLVLPVILWLAAICFVILAIVRCSDAQAQVRVDCESFANAIGYFADMRDVRGGLEETVALARRRNSDLGEMESAVLEREIRRMWKEGLRREDAMWRVYQRCFKQMGDMGADS